MNDVKRYRRRDIVAGIVAAHADLYPPELLSQMAHQLRQTDPRTLALVYREQTLREVVFNPCGLFYGLAHEVRPADDPPG